MIVRIYWTVDLLVVCIFLLLISIVKTSDERELTNSFAVKLVGSYDVAEEVAANHGLIIEKHLHNLGNIFVFSNPGVSRRSKRSALHLVDKLRDDPKVLHAEQEVSLKRVKRRILHDKQWELPLENYEFRDLSISERTYPDGDSSETNLNIDLDKFEVDFNDPKFHHQWYLVNTGQTKGPKGYDVNVMPVWKKGYTGKGIVVCVLDDGILHTHEDISANYDPEASTDMNGDNDKRDDDPLPNEQNEQNSHGTRCAGEIAAAANNSICGVGIAYEASIGGIRMLDGTVTDSLEATALTFNKQHIDIFSASWGPSDDGETMEAPGKLCSQALVDGTSNGRNGKGNIYVWATGNGGVAEDDCNCDGYVSSIYTLSIGCINDMGLSTYFTELCPSTMAVIFTGGSHDAPGTSKYRDSRIKIVTTDFGADHQGCTERFQGTSSAAPLAAGCFALVLQANPQLTWRDMQHLVVETARIPNDQEPNWFLNGAKHHVHLRFGFGAIDCGRMVEASQNWSHVGEQHTCEVPANNNKADIRSKGIVTQSLTTDGCQGNKKHYISELEHVQLHIKFVHTRRGDINIDLISPSGTKSNMLSLRPNDAHATSVDFTFMTVFNWGEDPAGTWQLSVTDNPPTGSSRYNSGELIQWSLTLWGTAQADKKSSVERQEDDAKVDETGAAHRATYTEIEKIMASEEESSEDVVIRGEDGPDVTTADTYPDAPLRSHIDDVRNDGSRKDTDPLTEEELDLLMRLLNKRNQLNHRRMQQPKLIVDYHGRDRVANRMATDMERRTLKDDSLSVRSQEIVNLIDEITELLKEIDDEE